MIDELCAKIRQLKAPVVAGLDPMLSYVPDYIIKQSLDEFGETLEGARTPSGSSTGRSLTIFMT